MQGQMQTPLTVGSTLLHPPPSMLHGNPCCILFVKQEPELSTPLPNIFILPNQVDPGCFYSDSPAASREPTEMEEMRVNVRAAQKNISKNGKRKMALCLIQQCEKDNSDVVHQRRLAS